MFLNRLVVASQVTITTNLVTKSRADKGNGVSENEIDIVAWLELKSLTSHKHNSHVH